MKWHLGTLENTKGNVRSMVFERTVTGLKNVFFTVCFVFVVFNIFSITMQKVDANGHNAVDCPVKSEAAKFELT